MIERSTDYDNEFAAAVTLEDIEEAKHGTLEWLHSPIKLTPLEKSRGMDGTMQEARLYPGYLERLFSSARGRTPIIP